MNIVYFGTPEFAVRPYRALVDAGYAVAAVVTQPDRQSGRGRKVMACPVKGAAEELGHEVLQPQRVRERDFISRLRQINPDAVVVVAYGQILPKEIIGLPRCGCVNIHASLLPAYRGAAPINWAIIKGERRTGITTMIMDEGMDTGPILLQQETGISDHDTAGSLAGRLSEMGASLIVETLQGLERGDLKPVPQSGEVSYAPLMKKSDGLLNWSDPAQVVCRVIHGMNPWPGAYSYLGKERIRIMKAVTVDGEEDPGVIAEAGKGRLIVGTGEGRISLLTVQPSGKPAMDIRSFLQGRAVEKGMRFSSEQ